MPTDKLIQSFDHVYDASGGHRLVMNFADVTKPEAKGKSYNFHSLVWEAASSGRWCHRLTITRASFARGPQQRRWIYKVHSFGACTGRAVIQVGEEGLPDEAGVMHVTYTWREWDLLHNIEVRTLQICDRDSFDAPPRGA